MKRTYRLFVNGDSEGAELEDLGHDRFHVDTGDGKPFTYTLREIRDGLILLEREDGQVKEVPYYTEGAEVHLSIDGHIQTYEVYDELQAVLKERSVAAAGSDGAVTVAMPGRVVTVEVEVGDNVTAGQGVCVIEAMKMENELKAPIDGTVSAVHIAPGDVVESGQKLLEVEATE